MSAERIVIDGSMGEGGGQVLRTSLSLSLATRRPLRIERIRASRAKPGLRAQHLTAVAAAARVGSAHVEGAALGSTELTFEPSAVAPGEYRFSVGTAGSATLVIETVLPPLLLASAPSRIRVEGGTNNPMAPPFDFLAHALLPLIERMGPRFEATLIRPGFFPAGGGACDVVVHPAASLDGLDLRERGEIRSRRARALVSRLPRHIAERELRVVRDRLGWREDETEVVDVTDAAGPGNVVLLEVVSEHLTAVVSAFGERGKPAEVVADEAVAEMRLYLDSRAPVDPRLADQLLLPLALAGRGAFVTTALSRHSRTNIDVIAKFLDLRFVTAPVDELRWLVTTGR